VRSILRSAVVGSAIVAAIASSIAANGCGFDGLGTLEGSATQVDGAAPALDADVDHELTVSGDASGASDGGADADAGPRIPGPCEDSAMILCMGFDGALVDEAHGQRVDKSGTVSFVPGVVGQAALLDVSSAITVPDGPPWKYSSITVEMWVRRDMAPPAGGRAGLLDKDNSFGMFTYPDGTVSCIMGGAVATGPVFTSTPTWVHVACVNDGTTTRLYADGLAKVVISAGAVPTTTALAAVGNNSPNLGSPLVGAIDLLRVYSRAKTAAEIAADAVR
jgi:hypothetical protein